MFKSKTNANKPTANNELHQAITDNKDLATIESLITAENLTATFGVNRFTPLHRAVEQGNAELVELLLSHGARANVTDINGRTPLHLAVNQDHKPCAELLLADAASLIAKDKAEGVTPLHAAAHKGRLELLKLFFEGKNQDAKKNLIATTDNIGRTLISYAASQGDPEVLDYLLKQLSVNNQAELINQADTKSGRTPLMFAIIYGFETNAIRLAVHGADTTLKNNGGWDIYDYAASHNRQTCISAISRVLQPGIFLDAAQRNDSPGLADAPPASTTVSTATEYKNENKTEIEDDANLDGGAPETEMQAMLDFAQDEIDRQWIRNTNEDEPTAENTLFVEAFDAQYSQQLNAEIETLAEEKNGQAKALNDLTQEQKTLKQQLDQNAFDAQLNEKLQGLTLQMATLQKTVDKLDEVYEQKQAVKKAREALKSNPSAYAFFSSLQGQLNALLLTWMALSTGMVSRTNYTFSDKAKNAVEKAALAIPVFGPLIPLIGSYLIKAAKVVKCLEFTEALLPDAAHHAMSHAWEKVAGRSEASKIKLAAHHTVTPATASRIAEQTALQLTKRYLNQISKLTPREGKTLAECAMKRMLEYVKDDLISEDIPFDQQFTFAVYSYGGFKHGALGLRDVQFKTQDPQTHKSWTADGVFSRTGIIYEANGTSHVYEHKSMDVQKYGYRQGTPEEVDILNATHDGQSYSGPFAEQITKFSQLSSQAKQGLTGTCNVANVTHDYEFKTNPLAPSDAGFSVLGTSRNNLVALFTRQLNQRDKSKREDFCQRMAPSVFHFFANGTLGFYLNKEYQQHYYQLQENYDKVYGEAGQALVNRLNQRLRTDLSMDELIQGLLEENTIRHFIATNDNDFNQLRNFKSYRDEAKSFVADPDVVRQYLDNYLTDRVRKGGQSNWLHVNDLCVYGMLKRKNIYLWQMDKNNHGKLTLMPGNQTYFPNGEEVHILYEDSYSHFNALTVSQHREMQDLPEIQPLTNLLGDVNNQAQGGNVNNNNNHNTTVNPVNTQGSFFQGRQEQQTAQRGAASPKVYNHENNNQEMISPRTHS